MTPMRVDQDATLHPSSRVRSASSTDVLWHPTPSAERSCDERGYAHRATAMNPGDGQRGP
jgi:hypothetical protein